MEKRTPGFVSRDMPVPTVPDERTEYMRQIHSLFETECDKRNYHSKRAWVWASTAPSVSDTEKAKGEFWEEIRNLPGVLDAKRSGGKTLAEQAFQVYIRPDDVETEYAVYRLKGLLYDRYPNVYIEVIIIEEGTERTD